MSLADLLSTEGHPPKDLATTALVHLEQTDGGWAITRIELDTVGLVEGVDAATFERARGAGEGDLPGVARTRRHRDHAACGVGAQPAREGVKSDTVASRLRRRGGTVLHAASNAIAERGSLRAR